MADPPNWSINPADFQYNGSITSIVLSGDENVTNENDMLIAKVNNEVRGITTSNYFPPVEAWVFNLMIFSNSANGENISFEFYNASEDVVYEIIENYTFSLDMTIGDAITPFIMHPGFSLIYGCTDPLATNYNPEANFNDGSCEYNCTDIDGNNYATVQIGNQNWMAENLKTTHYNNGDEIPTGLSNADWNNAIEGAYAVYNNDPMNANVYGNLYNGFTVVDERGICPEGFSIPTVDDWTELEVYLGGENIAGGKLKEVGTEHWLSPNTGGTNESGFTALPSGFKNPSYINLNIAADLWLSTEFSSDELYSRGLGASYTLVNHYVRDKNYGFSVRCLADENTTGCTDPYSPNYNEAANIDDGSCTYPDNGDYSLSFDGVDDYVILNEELNINSMGSLTFEIWVLVKSYINGGISSGDGSYLIDRQVVDSSDPLFDIKFINNGYALQTRYDNMEVAFGIVTNNTVSLNVWQHVAIVRDYGIEFRIYVDGILKATQVDNLNPISLQNIKFGGHNFLCPGNGCFDGIIDKVKISNSAIYEENFNPLLNLISDGNTVGIWNFKTGVNNTLYDHSGNGNHGTIYGAKWQYEIPLHTGANLISFRSLPEDNAIENVFGSIENVIEGVIGSGEAATYLPPWVGSLSHIYAESGYWVNVSEDVDFSVTSENLSDPNRVYELVNGANLVSYPSGYSTSLYSAIPSPTSNVFTGVIGEGVASTNLNGFWVGSLTDFHPNKGYWFKVTENLDFQYEYTDAELSRQLLTDDVEKTYIQSTQQAFYFIEDIENIEVGDKVSAYCNDILVGSRMWTGPFTDIPTMGNDSSDLTKDYCTENSMPTFRVEKQNGEMYALSGDIPLWESNGLLMVQYMRMIETLPETYRLASAYPNPFNPTTMISFELPELVKVKLEVYNVNGQLVNTLIDSRMDAGYHSIIWGAGNHASGIYFVKMFAHPLAGGIAGEFVQTQKLMLIK